MGLFSSKTEPSVDVVAVLKEDHDKVKELFEKFEDAKGSAQKKQIVTQALKALTVHAQIEEEIFYPAFREANSDDDETDDLMDEALQEHHVVKFLIGELEEMEPGDEFYDAKFTVLSENVKHHIEEEESDIFPKIEEDGSNWAEVGERLATRRQELMKEGTAHKRETARSSRSNGNSTARTSNGQHSTRAASKSAASTRKASVARRK
jgi:hemerythrin superfamily protein